MPIVITGITEVDVPDHWTGFTIRLSDPAKNITCKIENWQKCCEKWGADTDRETIHEFIGAEYLFTEIQDVQCEEEYSQMVFVEIHIHTNQGILTIRLHNEHNGYNTHQVFIETEHGHRYMTL